MRFLLILFLLLASGCGSSPPWANRNGPVILITVDTLRADHLSCYGYSILSTPHFDGLAQEGALFTDASATMPMTLPSHTTIMTGLTPPSHGVRDNNDYHLPEQAATLAERFQEAGYDTAAFVSSFVLDRRFGLSQGFAHYNDDFSKSPRDPAKGLEHQKDAARVTEEAVQWLQNREKDRFFLWIHYFDPHTNYTPPSEFSPEGRHPYDGEIAYVDDRLQRLFTVLKRLDLYDEATIILTSDHGEALGDHGEATHGFLTYQATIRIPLIIKSSGIPVVQVEEPVSLTDIFPTLMELCLLDEEPIQCDGSSLVPLMLMEGQGKRNPRTCPVYFESYLPTLFMSWSGLRGIRSGSLKYIESSEPELYDLEKDAGERNNVATHGAEPTRGLSRILSGFREQAKKGALPAGWDMQQEEGRRNMEALMALGYIGGTTLPIDQLERTAGRVAPQSKVIEYESFLSDYLTARTLEFSGDHEKAAALYRRAARKAPTYYRIADIHTSAARCLLHGGKAEEAKIHGEAALKSDPEFLPAYLVLGEAEDRLGRGDLAEKLWAECFRKAEASGLPSPQTTPGIRKRGLEQMKRDQR